MANGRIIVASYVDDSSATTPISASSEAATMPVTNLTNSLPSVKWRSGSYTAGNTIYISMDIGSIDNRTVNAFVFYNHNLSVSGQYRLKAYDSAANRDADTTGASTTGEIYDSEWITALTPVLGYGEGAYATFGYGGYSDEAWQYQFTALYMSANVVTRYWRLFLKDTGNTDGYIDAGRLMLSYYFAPANNFDWGYTIDWVDPSEQIRTRGGALRSEYRSIYRRASITWSWLDEFEYGQLTEIKRVAGRRNEIFWSGFPESGTAHERRNMILGRMVEWSPTKKERQGYQVSLTIEESI